LFQYTYWLRLNIGTRHKLAGIFNIPKKKSTHVANDIIVDDGYYVQDVESSLNVGALQEYTGLETDDVHVLWEAMIAKAEYVEPVPVAEVPKAVIVPPLSTEEILAVRDALRPAEPIIEETKEIKHEKSKKTK
jgi:hypothetical protein